MVWLCCLQYQSKSSKYGCLTCFWHNSSQWHTVSVSHDPILIFFSHKAEFSSATASPSCHVRTFPSRRHIRAGASVSAGAHDDATELPTSCGYKLRCLKDTSYQLTQPCCLEDKLYCKMVHNRGTASLLYQLVSSS